MIAITSSLITDQPEMKNLGLRMYFLDTYTALCFAFYIIRKIPVLLGYPSKNLISHYFQAFKDFLLDFCYPRCYHVNNFLWLFLINVLGIQSMYTRGALVRSNKYRPQQSSFFREASRHTKKMAFFWKWCLQTYFWPLWWLLALGFTSTVVWDCWLTRLPGELERGKSS